MFWTNKFTGHILSIRVVNVRLYLIFLSYFSFYFIFIFISLYLMLGFSITSWSHSHVITKELGRSLWKSDYQADLNLYSFWKHCFNREWHFKKYQEFQEIRKQSTCSAMSSVQAWLLKKLKYFHKTFIRTICLLILF